MSHLQWHIYTYILLYKYIFTLIQIACSRRFTNTNTHIIHIHIHTYVFLPAWCGARRALLKTNTTLTIAADARTNWWECGWAIFISRYPIFYVSFYPMNGYNSPVIMANTDDDFVYFVCRLSVLSSWFGWNRTEEWIRIRNYTSDDGICSVALLWWPQRYRVPNYRYWEGVDFGFCFNEFKRQHRARI